MMTVTVTNDVATAQLGAECVQIMMILPLQ
jgi:hypothetical protein